MIIGATKPDHVHANVAASGVELDEATIAAVDEALADVAITEPRLGGFAQRGRQAPLIAGEFPARDAFGGAWAPKSSQRVRHRRAGMRGASAASSARAQLVALGYSGDAIKHRVASGRIRRVRRGVYVVGLAEVDRTAELIAATLACGPPLPPAFAPSAWIGHLAGAEHLGMLRRAPGPIDVSVTTTSPRHVAGVRVHRRPSLDRSELVVERSVPVTSPARTLVDLASVVPRVGCAGR